MFNLRTEFVFVLHNFKYYGFNKINTIYYWPAYTQYRRARLVTVAGVCRHLSSVVVYNTDAYAT